MAVLKQQQYEALPVGEYEAAIGALVVEPSKFGNGDQVRVRFDIKTRGFEDRSVFGYASAVFSPSSKLYAWTKAAFGGRDIPKDYSLDTDHLLDRRLLITLVQRAGEDGTLRNRIDSVRAIPNGKPGPSAARTPAPAAAAALAAAPAPGPARSSQGGGVIPRTGAGAQPTSSGRVLLNQPSPDDIPDWLQDPGEGEDGELPF